MVVAYDFIIMAIWCASCLYWTELLEWSCYWATTRKPDGCSRKHLKFFLFIINCGRMLVRLWCGQWMILVTELPLCAF